MKKNQEFKGLTGLFPGSYIFTVTSALVDTERKNKSDDMKIVKQAVALTTKNIKINQLKLKEIAGGVSVLEVNGGGANGLEFGAHEQLGLKSLNLGDVDLSAGKIDGEKKKMFTTDIREVVKTANAFNASEVFRLKKITEDLKGQISFLEGVIEANNAAVETFSEEE